MGDSYPDERDQVSSLAQQYYIATFTCWTNPTWDEPMTRWMKSAYTRAERVSCGTYIADLDRSLRVPRVMTDSALKRFLDVRKKWDPEERFTGHRGFAFADSRL